MIKIYKNKLDNCFHYIHKGSCSTIENTIYDLIHVSMLFPSDTMHFNLKNWNLVHKVKNLEELTEFYPEEFI